MKNFNRYFDIIETSVANMVNEMIKKVPFGLHNTVEPIWIDGIWGFTILGDSIDVAFGELDFNNDRTIKKVCDFTKLSTSEQRDFVQCFETNIDNIIVKGLEEQCHQCYDTMNINDVSAYHLYFDLIHIKGKQLAKMKGIEWHWQKTKELSIENNDGGCTMIFCGNTVTLTIEPKSLILAEENTYIRGDITDQYTNKIIYKDVSICLDEASIYLLDNVVKRLNALIGEGK